LDPQRVRRLERRRRGEGRRRGGRRGIILGQQVEG
jgi:hypothetical protein